MSLTITSVTFVFFVFPFSWHWCLKIVGSEESQQEFNDNSMRVEQEPTSSGTQQTQEEPCEKSVAVTRASFSSFDLSSFQPSHSIVSGTSYPAFFRMIAAACPSPDCHGELCDQHTTENTMERTHHHVFATHAQQRHDVTRGRGRLHMTEWSHRCFFGGSVKGKSVIRAKRVSLRLQLIRASPQRSPVKAVSKTNSR